MRIVNLLSAALTDSVDWRSQCVRTLRSSGVLLALLVSSSSAADTYKYQDHQGRWHYTDRPPVDRQQPLETLPTSVAQARPSRDLNALLRTKFPPQNPLQEATLSTVTVKTSISTGSGFFISTAGHILTNKHVIQLPETQREKLQASIGEAEQQLDRLRKRLAWREEELNKFRTDLARYQTALHTLPEGSDKAERQEYYQAKLSQYQVMETELADDRRQFQQQESAVTSQRREFDWKLAVAGAARTFTVVLKDGAELSATLIATSQNHDLALLKVDSHQTPKLQPAALSEIGQGVPVYAIGSPLGLRDSISTGVVSGIEPSFIRTDAKIVPGNSGGPLVLTNGHVIGINTLKQIIQGPEGQFEGFGFAIAIEIALQEFARDLPRD